jgi:ankyrin repeat protein
MTEAKKTVQDVLENYANGDVYEFANLGPLEVKSRGHEGFTPLHIACNQNFEEDAKLLLEAGAEVDAEGEENIRPLHWAIIGGNVNIVKLLLAYGADPLKPSKFGNTPSDLARQVNSSEILAELEKRIKSAC